MRVYVHIYAYMCVKKKKEIKMQTQREIYATNYKFKLKSSTIQIFYKIIIINSHLFKIITKNKRVCIKMKREKKNE